MKPGREAVALVVALGVAVAVVLLAAAAAWAEASKHLAVSKESATLLSTVLGALVGAVATYLGVRVQDAAGTTKASGGAGEEAPGKPGRETPPAQAVKTPGDDKAA